ncbi:MAG: hypothetical protein Q4E35_08180 [Eubacteriales bacterium]|nr:hypothetical protein [Eubacteriales bacterium]
MTNHPDSRQNMPTVTLYVSAREAQQGCIYDLEYPGGTSPMKLTLPEKMYDGMVLYVNEARFYDRDGRIFVSPLRLVIHITKPAGRTVKLWPVVTLFFIALVLLGFLIYREFTPSPAPVPTPTPVVVTPAPEELVPTAAPTEQPPVLSEVQLRAQSLIPHFENRYLLGKLDDRLLENFCTMYSAVSNFETACTFNRPMDRDEFSNLSLLLSYECPELLQFSTGGEISFTTDTNGIVVGAMLPIVLTRQEFATEYSVCDAAAKELAEKCAGMSESEKEMAAYNYLTSVCYYNFNAASGANAFGALGEHQAKCDGISLAMKWLLEEMDMCCMVIAGTASADAVGHAWNLVSVDGEFYDLDVTNDVMSYERDYKYFGAYNVSRFWIRDKYSVNMSFEDFIELPGCLNMNNSYHHLNGHYVYSGAEYEHMLFEQLSSLGEGESAYIQFESYSDYQNFKNNINTVMSRWSGTLRGSFDYHFAHLDEFRVCRITVSFSS